MNGRGGQSLLGALLLALPLAAAEFSFPTNAPAALLHRTEDFLQPTVSGKIESGAFGMVREEGHRFHEGIDVRAMARNAGGEPLDLILAASDGQIAYLNATPNGSYGRYLVLVHPQAELPVYTLYAHLAKIEPSLKLAGLVKRGQPIGLMGYSSTGRDAIPKERAHLHFEIGLLMTTVFPSWYKMQAENKGSPNLHGIFNGQNLVGLDPLRILSQTKPDLLAAVRQQPAALAVTIRAKRPPDFITRYPALANGDTRGAVGWYVEFSWQGMPMSWTPLMAGDGRLPREEWALVAIDFKQQARLTQRKMVLPDGRRPGETLLRQVQLLLAGTR